MTGAPRLSLAEAALFERPVALRMPFRFGAATLTEARQAFVRVRIRLADGREGAGAAAELLAPKWFDKNPALSDEDNAWQLRDSLATAIHLYAAAGPAAAFGLWRATYRDQQACCAAAGLNPLAAGFGPALLDKAILDALCRLGGASVFAAMRENAAGIEAGGPAPDLEGFDLAAFLRDRARAPAPAIAARHTIGGVDPLSGAGTLADGLPETLEQAIAAYGLRYFKIKAGGEVAADLERLRAIAAVLDRIAEPWFVTLDGNERYAAPEALEALLRALGEDPALRRLREAILFVEQPFPRAMTLDTDVSRLALGKPLLIDEADGTADAFPRARALGYAGVSSKSCKGLYKSILNAARCRRWNDAEGARRHFMSAEDLMTQPGLALQQDLALASLIGCAHVERNGHHYANGMAGAPPAEREAFAAAHADLYRRAGGTARLRIERGAIALGSLSACPGFASAALPDFAAMQPMPERD